MQDRLSDFGVEKLAIYGSRAHDDCHCMDDLKVLVKPFDGIDKWRWSGGSPTAAEIEKWVSYSVTVTDSEETRWVHGNEETKELVWLW